jgi:acylphosphatase
LEGNKEQIEKAVREYRKGPPGAAVSHIELTWEESMSPAGGFEIRYE